MIADAAWIAETVGRPWEFVDRDTTARDRVRAAAREKAPAGKDAAFDTWWEQVSSRDNAVGNFRCLPDAWDGSLNFLRSAGKYQQFFDLGPLSVTYSTIGTAEQEATDGAGPADGGAPPDRASR